MSGHGHAMVSRGALNSSSGIHPLDAMLVALLVARDPRAMGWVYDRWGQSVYATALRILGDRAAAEEVVLEAHLMLWRHPELALTHHDSLHGYLVEVVSCDARQRRVAARVTGTECARSPHS